MSVFPANCPKQQEARQKWAMEKGTRQKTGLGNGSQIQAHARRSTAPAGILRENPATSHLAALCIQDQSTFYGNGPLQLTDCQICCRRYSVRCIKHRNPLRHRPTTPDNEGHAPDSGRTSQNGNQKMGMRNQRRQMRHSSQQAGQVQLSPATLYATLASIRPSARERINYSYLDTGSRPARMLGIACG